PAHATGAAACTATRAPIRTRDHHTGRPDRGMYLRVEVIRAAAQKETRMAEETDLFDIIHTTRAMRRLKPDPVPDELVRKILEAGIAAANGGNRQTWRFLVIKDRTIKERVQHFYK